MILEGQGVNEGSILEIQFKDTGVRVDFLQTQTIFQVSLAIFQTIFQVSLAIFVRKYKLKPFFKYLLPFL